MTGGKGGTFPKLNETPNHEGTWATQTQH